MKKQVDTINLTPTPKAYVDALLIIIQNSNKFSDVTWAKEELYNLARAAASLNPEAWGKEE